MLCNIDRLESFTITYEPLSTIHPCTILTFLVLSDSLKLPSSPHTLDMRDPMRIRQTWSNSTSSPERNSHEARHLIAAEVHPDCLCLEGLEGLEGLTDPSTR